MLIAYNNDIEFRSRWYHIQTEDNGIKDGHITTTVFYSGQILDSKSISYREAVSELEDQEAQNRVIKELMVKQHQEFYAKLYDGRYESIVANVAQRTSGNSSLGSSVRSSQAGIPVVGGRSTEVGNGEASHLGNSKINKPDILRASQQFPSASKGLGLKSLTGTSAKLTPVSPSNGSKGLITAPPAMVPLSVPQVATSGVRLAHLSQPLERSKAVLSAKKSKSKRDAYRGIRWPNDDLAMDVLVARILEDQPL
ncbi:MAG: hypothetical protein FWC40_01970 [Proteobacteria bacterium]|nr:hypothetical protein [Pseudomonadota bacterium]